MLPCFYDNNMKIITSKTHAGETNIIYITIICNCFYSLLSNSCSPVEIEASTELSDFFPITLLSYVKEITRQLLHATLENFKKVPQSTL